MQQTNKYKLNLIETSDPFSANALNENAQKTEAVLSAETAMRQSETAALDSRVTVLELDKVRMAAGSYVGDGTTSRIIPVGFTPKAVLVVRRSNFYIWMVTAPISFFEYNCENLKCVEGGIWISKDGSSVINSSGTTYCYIAFG